jgi:hypothetical protein
VAQTGSSLQQYAKSLSYHLQWLFMDIILVSMDRCIQEIMATAHIP